MNNHINKRFIVVLACLFGLLAFVFFYKLGVHPLADYDESIYAQVAQESFLHHNQLGFTWLGNIGFYRSSVWFEKPPLMIWLIEANYKIFGINELAARLWPSIFAFATASFTFLFVLKIFKSLTAAVLSLACYFIAFQFIYNAGVLQLDIPVTFFVLAALLCFWLSKESNKYFYLFWAALGLGLMTKSVIGLLPLPIIALYSLICRDWHYLKERTFWAGSLIFFAIVLPWHIIESLRYGKTFWNQYFSYHVFERYTKTLEGNKGDFLFYWRILAEQRGLLYLGIPSLIYFFYKACKQKGEYLLVAISVLFIFLFFSLAKTKLTAYILVIYPFLIVLVSVTLDRMVDFIENKNAFIGRLCLWGGCAVMVFLGLRYNNYKLLKNQDPYFVASKTVGVYLKNNQTLLPVYYYSTGTSPEIIFYSNRTVYYLPYPSPKPTSEFLLISRVKPDFLNAKMLISSGSSQSLYLIQ